MSTADSNTSKQLEAEAIVEHLIGGGTLKTMATISEKELEALYAVGFNLFTAQKYDKAIDIFKFLCLYDHFEPRWFYSLGVAQQRKGDYARALEAFAGATLLDATDPRPQLQAGYCLMALERYGEAESALEGVILTCGTTPGHDAIRAQAGTMLETARSKNAGKKG